MANLANTETATAPPTFGSISKSEPESKLQLQHQRSSQRLEILFFVDGVVRAAQWVPWLMEMGRNLRVNRAVDLYFSELQETTNN